MKGLGTETLTILLFTNAAWPVSFQNVCFHFISFHIFSKSISLIFVFIRLFLAYSLRYWSWFATMPYWLLSISLMTLFWLLQIESIIPFPPQPHCRALTWSSFTYRYAFPLLFNGLGTYWHGHMFIETIATRELHVALIFLAKVYFKPQRHTACRIMVPNYISSPPLFDQASSMG